MSERGRYLFAVATGLADEDLAAEVGLDGQPLEIVEHDSLQAVVCDVDLAEFGEEPLRRNLEDLSWVEKVARTHDAVVRSVAARATVAPLRLVTVCVGDESVVDRLRQWEVPLRAALTRVAGSREWSVKAYAAKAGAEASDERGSAEDTRTGSGLAYLQRKRDVAQRRDRSRALLAETAEAVHVALAGRARASRLLAPQDPQLSGRAEAMVLNGAYLVPESDEQRFAVLVDELRRRHPDVLLEVAGPWAPYSFAVLEATP
jgi:hypothetical protein